jgi:hypothetical protein
VPSGILIQPGIASVTAADLTLAGSATNTTSVNAGNVVIVGGSANGTSNANGGNVDISGGDPGTGTGQKGSVNITGGNNSSMVLPIFDSGNVEISYDDNALGSGRITFQPFIGIELQNFGMPGFTGSIYSISLPAGGGIQIQSPGTIINIDVAGSLTITGLATSCAGKPTGTIVNIAGVLNVCP